jgi:ABC-2 type transport system permease protein
MNTFTTLLKREWLEAKVPFFWLPVGALAFLVIVSLLGLIVSGFSEIHISMESNSDESAFFFIDDWSEREVGQRMAAFRNLVTAPFYFIYLIAALFVLLGTLYDDRKDRSVLFWKSMPVDDYQTVASKLVLAVLIAPLIMLACALVAQLFLLIVGTVFISTNDLGSTSRLWAQSGLISGTLKSVLGFLIQAFWSLPVTGFLLLISASVPRLTLLWALVVPVSVGIAEFVIFRTKYISDGLSRHMEPAALPNFIGDDERIMPVVSTVGDQLALFVTADMWIGVVIGLAFLYGAVRMRGIKNEI